MASMAEDKRAKLAELLRQSAQQSRVAPLSFAQERMWFLDQWSPGSAAFNLPFTVRLTGELHLEALQHSLQELVRRHEVLRTTFTIQAGLPVQVIGPSLHISLPLVEMQGSPVGEREQQVQERIAAEAARPFDLTEGPLFRAVLFRSAAREHILLINMHHIVSDGWSLGVLVRDLVALYQAHVLGRPALLAPLPLQYADYAMWQREWLQGEVLDEQLAYWRERLDPDAVLELPADRPRPAALGPRGARQVVLWPQALGKAIKDLGQREGRTLFVVLLAAFKVLLSRYTGQDDLVVGSPIAGRTRAELEGLIGVFVNALALRTSLAGRPAFRELMGRVRQTALEAYAHQELPFEKLVDALKPGRHLSHPPVFQVMFILQNAPMPPLEAPGLLLEARPVDVGATKLELTLSVAELAEGLRFSAEYSTDLFDAETIRRLLAHLQALLSAAVARPDQCIAELPLIEEAERHRLLVEWNETAADYPRGACLHELFEAQVVRTPQAVAVRLGEQELTYSQMNARANQLARHLRQQGVRAEARVAIALPRSPEMIVGLLAIMKAGGAYVPLDPGYPQDRLAFMLQDSRASVLVTRQALGAHLPAAPGCSRVLIDAEWPAITLHSDGDLPGAVTLDSPAYVLYTSGSTGTPKGVVGLHRGAVNRCSWMWRAFPFAPGEVCCQKTTLGFVDAVWEIFGPLLQGVPLVLLPDDSVKDPMRLVQCLAEAHVTRLVLVPSLLRALLEAPVDLAARLSHLGLWTTSGEALSRELAEAFAARLPHATLINLYGMSEAAADSTCFILRPGEPAIARIGRPIANTRVYVLDRDLQPVPVGVPGELYLGGEGLARGYWGRPELTAERFVPDPFLGEGARMYRSGDRARWVSGGQLEYLGRVDHQVKVRGVRVELGDVESVLREHPAVRQAVVLAREDRPGEQRLVAYVVGKEGLPDSGALRDFLRRRLPEHMVPSVLVALGALPLTPSGKVDRRALPAAGEGRLASPRPYEVPRTELERAIAEVWQRLLKVQRIGLHDDFFELGGHSLLAAQLRNHFYTAFKVDLPLQALFNASTVSGLAALIEKELAENAARGEAEQPTAERLRAAFPTERQGILEEYLRRRIARGLRRAVKELPADGSLTGLDLRLLGAELQYDLRQDFKLELFPHELREHPSIPALARYLVAELDRLADLPLLATDEPLSAYPPRPYRQRAGGGAGASGPARKNRGMVFVHSSPRAGSTLLRVMLAGHPRLFSPPELKLLFFETMREWRESVGLGREAEWTEGGLLWALMEIEGLDSAAGQARIDELVARRAPVQDVYARLQELAGPRLLVDKTPGYSLDPDTLWRAEEMFDQPKYLYLFRHPYPVMESLLRVRIDRLIGPILFGDAEVDPHIVAETVWALSNRSLLDFSDRVGPARCHWVRYEDLVSEPGRVMSGVCEFLGIPFDARVLRPYDGKRERMLGGVGDPNILRHDRIDSKLGESWRRIKWPRPLDPGTRALAARLGYEVADAPGPVEAPVSRRRAWLRRAPLSFAQERIWFLTQLAPGDPSFNMRVTVRLAGPLDVAALEASLDQIVRRHESLRTTFVDRDGVPAQVINPAASLSVPVRDLGTLPEAEREAHAQRLATEEAQRPFDLARGPLFRASLLRLGEEQHVLLMQVHHLVSDGWSQAVLLRELATLYQAFVEEKPAPLPALPVQYADFSAWQRRALGAEQLQGQWEYWRQRLAGPLPVIETIAARSPAGGSTGLTRRAGLLRLPLQEALQRLSQQAGVTLFMTLLGAFKVLLHRYTGQTDMVVGSPIADRDRSELEGLVGLFLNTLVLRTDLGGDPTFLELLRRVRQTVMEAFEHKHLPFGQLVAKLRPDRNLGRNALFQVTFVMQGAMVLPELPGLKLSLFRPELRVGAEVADVIGISLQETPEGLSYVLEYQSDLNDRILEHYRILLEGVVADPGRRISALPLLEGAEREQLLKLGNGLRADYPMELCVQELIEAQARRTPEAVALVFEGRSLTYREVDVRASQLAHQLRSLGVRQETRVGVCLERSLELVVGLLGILKAGGAYVPLEPSYPRERLGWILEDARPTVLLVHERLLERLPPHEARVVCLEPGWGELARQPEHGPAPLATADNLAYVIFTSGSTGRPKGAMNIHRGVCNRLSWMQDAYGLNESDVVLQKTPFGFDVSVWEFFWPLMTGARLVVARPGGHQEPEYLLRLIAEEGVTTLHFVPSMLQVFLEAAGLERCTSLRRVVCSGEALPLELKERCLDRLPWAALHNLYGPTEAAVDVTYHACQRGDGRRSVPIGRPVANTSIRILDANLEPVPAGVPGELYIGGVQVGRGYLGRPELTAERFIPDVFAVTPGARLYRTGDVARWLPDGNIEYLGRADFQVKLRGLRIELGEIEAALGQHPKVRQAVVVLREDEPGERRLVAYVVAHPGGPALEVGELRQLLRERLPEYMVPSAFVVLDALPLGPSGKLDRRALPAPGVPRDGQPPASVEPESAIEKKLAEIWLQVLKVESVGVHDNFFEVGGHSLLAAQVLSRANQAFGTSLPVQSLFQDSTIASLALRIEEALLDELEAEERHDP